MSFPVGPKMPSALATYRLIKTPNRLLASCHEQYGDTFTLRLLRPGKVVFVSHPNAVQELFTTLAKKLLAGQANSFLSPFLGENSVLLLDGPRHARQRRLMLPSFHGDKMKMFGNLMRDTAYQTIQTWKPGETVMIRQEMQAITLRVIVESIFGSDMSRRTPEIIELVRGTLNIPTLITFLPFLRVNLGPWSKWGRFLAWRNRLDKLLFGEIALRRANPPAEPRDVMDMLMAAVDEDGSKMSDQEVRDELITLMLAGHETTALSLTWAFATLLKNQDILEKLKKELSDVVGDRAVSLDDLPRLKYLDATIKESMRMNLLFPIILRKAAEPVSIDGYDIPEGAGVAAATYVTHHREDVYSDPYAFKPERWLNGQIHQFAWFPFGGAPRRCLGMAFAIFEMNLILASIIPHVQMELIPNQDLTPTRMGLALAPPSGVRVRITANPVDHLSHEKVVQMTAQ
ncbi:MAG TPA: cytochrome P450 [Blastocatellia bacterium]|nr:cytochrome P450 [Blastocatellia bacterium]